MDRNLPVDSSKLELNSSKFELIPTCCFLYWLIVRLLENHFISGGSLQVDRPYSPCISSYLKSSALEPNSLLVTGMKGPKLVEPAYQVSYTV